MTVQRYRRKPVPASKDDLFAVRYEPGQPLDDLLAVARKADRDAQVAEVTFTSGLTVLAVRYEHTAEEHQGEIEYEVIEPGGYLAFSKGHWHLYVTNELDLKNFYDRMPGAQA